MLRVCILTETYHPVIGGGETQARLLAEGLVAAGASVHVVTRRSGRALAALERMGEVVVHRVPPVGRGRLRKWGLLLFVGPVLVRLRREYDLIFVSGFRTVGLVVVPVAHFLRKVVVLKSDSPGEMSGEFFAAGLDRVGSSRSSWVFRWFLRLRNTVLRRADAFVAISPDIEAEFAAAGIAPAFVHSVPNGVDTSRFKPLDGAEKASLRTRLGIGPEAPVIVYTGRLVSYKGLRLLIDVWPDILRVRPEARLLLVGEGGLDIHNCEQELRARVSAQGLQHSVTFVGRVDDVSPYLQAADLFAFPTENEAFGASLVEAMGCGLAAVATPVGAIPTIVRDGENGVLVQPGDAGQLKSALLRLLADPGFAARLGVAAHETAVAHYSAESVTRRYLDLFRKLIASRDPAVR